MPGKSGYEAFARVFVPKVMLRYAKLNLSEGDTASLDEYLEKRLGIMLSSSSILQYAIHTMLVSQNGDEYTFRFDTALPVPGYRMGLGELLGLLEYGNLEVRGCGIIGDMFGYVKANLNILLDSFIHSNGGSANGGITVR